LIDFALEFPASGKGIPRHGRPSDQSAKTRGWKWRIVLLLVVALIVTGFSYLAWRFTRDDPVTYKDPEEHFKYGSTGGERESGIPYWIGRCCPKCFLIFTG